MIPGTFFQEKIDGSKKNIWRYNSLFDSPIAPEFQISLEEGHTKTLEVAPPFSGLEKLFFKREDLNPNGSHKDRSAAYQISHYAQQGEKRVVVSSSGNAGLSLAAYGRVAGVEVILFLKEETHPFKLHQIGAFSPRIIFTPKPINLARYASRRYGIPNLRPSLDDTALEGYKTLAFEIWEEKTDVDSIFSFSTSGSSLLGLGLGFRALQKEGLISRIPAIHAVQAGPIASIASDFEEVTAPDGSQKGPGNLGVKHTARKPAVCELIRESGGWAWWINENEISRAHSLLPSLGLQTSLEGLACLAAVEQASREGRVKKPLILCTGHISQLPQSHLSFPQGETYLSYNDLRLVFDTDFGK